MEMKQYSTSNAREHFAQLLEAVERGEEVTITRHGKPVAKMTRIEDGRIPPPGWALREGWSITMSEDFDAIPEGFEEYT